LRLGGKAALAVALAAALGVSLRAVPATADDEASAGFYQKAESHLAAREWQAAVIELKNALRADPGNVEARLALGVLYLRLGDPAAAETELETARDRGIDPARIADPLARALLGQGKYEAVLRAFPAGTGATVPLVWRSFALLGLGRGQEAEAAARSAITADPKEARAHAALAYVLFAAGRTAEAEARVDEALTLAPAMPEALTLKGELRRVARDDTGALRSFGQALAIDPGALLARAGRAAVLIELGELDRAQQDVDTLRAAAPGLVVGLYLQAALLTGKHDLSGAIDLLARSSTSLDSYPAALKLLGSLYAARGELEQAQTYLSRYLALAGQDMAARKQLANVQLQKGQPAAAVELLLPSAQASNDPGLLGLLATAYLADHKPADAAQWFDRAAAAAPADAGVRTRVAVGRLQAGQIEAGLKDLETALALDPQQDAARILLALADLKARRFDAACEEAERLRARQPGSPMPDHLLGTILLAEGDSAGARAHFEAALELSPDFAPSQDNLARLDLAAGDLAGAQRRYEAILRAAPGSVAATMALARIAVALGRPEEAQSMLARAGTGNAAAIAPQMALVDLYLQLHRTDDALAAAQKLRDGAPSSLEAGETLARAQLATGQGELALTTLRQLAATSPGSARAQQLLARGLARNGDAAGARAALEAALRLDGAFLPAALDLVELEAASGEVETALAFAADWGKRNADDAGSDLLAGQALIRAGRPAEAAAAYERAFRRDPSTDTAVRWYGALLTAGRTDAAVAGLQEWVDRHPLERPAEVALAAALIQAKRYDAAARRYEHLLAAVPDDPVLLNNLAWLYDLRGDGRALEMAERAHRLLPGSPEIADTLGFILVHQGNAERGVELLRQAQSGSNQPEVTYHLAVALDRVGRAEEARAVLEQLLASAQPFDGRAEAVSLQKTLASQ
jgi:putative PEP-CTERM system TPR-repeat lipoprotein